MSNQASYELFSVPDGEPIVSIFLRSLKNLESEHPPGLEVQLNADRLTWTARPPIQPEGGSTELGVYTIPYTTDFNGEVYATNEVGLSRIWKLIPVNPDEKIYVITTGDGKGVWTAGDPTKYEAIKLREFEPDNRKQWFRFRDCDPN